MTNEDCIVSQSEAKIIIFFIPILLKKYFSQDIRFFKDEFVLGKEFRDVNKIDGSLCL